MNQKADMDRLKKEKRRLKKKYKGSDKKLVSSIMAGHRKGLLPAAPPKLQGGGLRKMGINDLNKPKGGRSPPKKRAQYGLNKMGVQDFNKPTGGRPPPKKRAQYGLNKMGVQDFNKPKGGRPPPKKSAPASQYGRRQMGVRDFQDDDASQKKVSKEEAKKRMEEAAEKNKHLESEIAKIENQLARLNGGQYDEVHQEVMRDKEKRDIKKYGGIGQRLGSSKGNVSGNNVDFLTALKKIYMADDMQESTMIQLVLLGGKKVKLKVNLDATILQIFQHVLAVTDVALFDLVAGFPPKPLKDPHQTIGGAGLKGARIIMKTK